MIWFKKNKECMHCRKNKTKRDFENQPICAACKMEILIGREPKRLCPADGTVMVKSHKNEIIIDYCPKCMGVWLDAGELSAIRAAATQDGTISGMKIGMI
ncbi:MAG: zf-TFIIB domain-containing protein [Oleispira sp.]